MSYRIHVSMYVYVCMFVCLCVYSKPVDMWKTLFVHMRACVLVGVQARLCTWKGAYAFRCLLCLCHVLFVFACLRICT